jgi:LGFP repeat
MRRFWLTRSLLVTSIALLIGGCSAEELPEPEEIAAGTEALDVVIRPDLPDIGEHIRCKTIDEYYQALGGYETFGVPNAFGEQTTTDGTGTFFHFSKGSIYRIHCPVALFGTMDDRYMELRGPNGEIGGPNGFMGLPVHEPFELSDGTKYVNFSKGATLVSSPTAGLHVVYGAIRQKWRSELGGLTGSLGYPVSDELASSDGSARLSRFQRGTICWTPSGGAVVAPVGATCNRPAPACTPRDFTLCCHGAELNHNVTGRGCTVDAAKQDAWNHMFGWCPLSEGACTSMCDSYRRYICVCNATGEEAWADACTAAIAADGLSRNFPGCGGFSSCR